ncbi:hypothetical protein CDL12_29538 [Handroanthus impetiginosus]|uniref:HSP20-like chaperones superfamily protein n=1 Tax=Handroanthus impetiginosus TaxID=429701 RepID=A0A2G9FYL5_9LAMI|nr:hypothetical protein CDL12_29538 [Handroanthus impetiginosus]
MGDTLLTALSMENHHPSTILSMDSSASSSHDELDLEMNRQVILTRPPDINLPLSAERNILDVGLGTQIYETESFLSAPKVGRKCAKRVDSIWGAWFFFSFYFKPVLNEKSKAKIIRDSNGVSGLDKSDLQLDTFMVQHDMENMYMWVFKERPENALGKMQLRSYMNGHSRQGERPFPFSVDKGFVRSHRMQRKHYRGLSNPQCVHGIEVVTSPNLMGLDEDDRKRWTELTGRELNFTIPSEASDYGSWRNLPNTEFELERPPAPVKANPHSHSKKLLNGSVLNLSTQPANHSNGDAMDLSPRVKVSWRNTLTQGIIKVSCISTSRTPFIKRHNRTFKLADPSSEHCPPGEFVREIPLSTRIPEDANIEAYYDGPGTVLEILVPKLREGPEEHEVRVCLRPHHGRSTEGIIKVSCISTSRTPFIKRHNRTFKLADPSSEHCPPGEFVREIPLSTRIPEDANIEAYYDGPGTVLEILVPKLREGPEEHEVRVCLRPHHGGNDLMLT